MTENGWQAIGRIARMRRERLGLKQDELAQYGGPRVATVGKFERAAQENFPTRTLHQIENALGWSRTTIEQVVNSIDEGTLTADDWEHDLVVEDVPDLSQPKIANADALDEYLVAVRGVLGLIAPERMHDATRAAILAIVAFLDEEGATDLGRGLRLAFPPEGGDGDADDTGRSAAKKVPEVGPAEQPTRQADYGLVADEDDTTIEQEQEQTESST